MIWTKTNNLYDYKRIVIPINPNKIHWALIIIDIWKGIIHYFYNFNKTHIEKFSKRITVIFE